MKTGAIDRRTVAKGAAWAIPTITVGAAAPAAAVSPPPAELGLNSAGRITWNKAWNTEYVDNYRGYKIFSTAGQYTNVPGAGYCVTNTTTSTRITQFTITYYLPYYYDLRFIAGPTGTNGWSLLAADSSKPSKYYNGVTYYPYSTTYQRPIVTVNGDTCLPSFEFQGPNGVNTTQRFFVDHTLVINDRTVGPSFGPIVMG